MKSCIFCCSRPTFKATILFIHLFVFTRLWHEKNQSFMMDLPTAGKQMTKQLSGWWRGRTSKKNKIILADWLRPLLTFICVSTKCFTLLLSAELSAPASLQWQRAFVCSETKHRVTPRRINSLKSSTRKGLEKAGLVERFSARCCAASHGVWHLRKMKEYR